jgi:5'-nucleotidase / UDP-sugar diphosphatase
MRCRQLKSTVIGLLALLAIVGLAAPRANAADPVPAGAIHVTFLHFSDVYELQPKAGKGGLAEAATILRNQRARNFNTIVTFGGNLLSPSFMSGWAMGSETIDMLDSIGVDYATLGNHEFDLGPDVLRGNMSLSDLTWLVTSVSEDDGSPFAGANTTAIRRIGPFTIGFFSIIATDSTERVKTGLHVHFLAPVVAAGEAVKALRAHGVDVVVALTHQPVADDKTLVDQVPGIDLVLGGDDLEPMLLAERGVPIVKAGRDAENLAVVDLTIAKDDAGKVTLNAASHLVPTLGAKPDAKLMASIAAYNTKFDNEMSEPVVTLAGELDSRAEIVRSAESSMGDLIADAMLPAIGADVAIINGGSIRGDKVYPAGSELTLGDLQRELPFGNTVVEIELSGADILAALENGVSKVADKAGRFPQVAGLAFVFDPGKPAGKRIKSVTVGGVPLDLKKIYKVATNEFMANGGDGYDMMARAKRGDALQGYLLTQVMVVYIHNRMADLPTPAGGRIRQVP